MQKYRLSCRACPYQRTVALDPDIDDPAELVGRCPVCGAQLQVTCTSQGAMR